MLKLNIIPQELKHEKKLKALFESLKIYFGIIIILFSIYAVALLAAKFILQLHFYTVMSTTSTSYSGSKNIEKPIRQINDQMKFISEVQKNNIQWSYLIEYLSNSAGYGIKYEKILINKENESIEINGFAKNRDDLIRFKEIIEKSGYFSDIELPIKNLLEKVNLTFKINAKINNYGFIAI